MNKICDKVFIVLKLTHTTKFNFKYNLYVLYKRIKRQKYQRFLLLGLI